MDILRNQMLIFRYKALFGLLFAVILNYEAASELRGIFGRGGRVHAQAWTEVGWTLVDWGVKARKFSEKHVDFFAPSFSLLTNSISVSGQHSRTYLFLFFFGDTHNQLPLNLLYIQRYLTLARPANQRDFCL